MRQGITSTACFNANIDLSAYDNVILTLEDTYPVREKQKKINIKAESVDGTKATFQITQEATLALRPGAIKMQLRASTSDGIQATTSNIITTVLRPALNKEEV